MAPVFDLALYLLIFGLILISIGIFIIVQFIKVEKIARPFLGGLFLYFIMMSAVNLIQSGVYFINPSLFSTTGIYNNYYAVILIYFAPLLLVFQIEKTYFQNKLLAKFHFVTLTIIIINASFLATTLPAAIADPSFIDNFAMTDYFLNTVNWVIIVSFICTAFLYLGIKSSGKYRLWSLVIFFGWVTNQAINAIGQLLPYATLLEFMTLIFIIKMAAALVTALGFVSLYALRSG